MVGYDYSLMALCRKEDTFPHFHVMSKVFEINRFEFVGQNCKQG